MNKKRKLFLSIGIPIVISVSLISFAFTEDLFEVSKNLDIFTSLFKEVNLYYVDDTKPGQLIKTAADAMLQSLDPYTEYYTENDIEDYKMVTTGQYGGIGAAVREVKGRVIITEPYENSPALKAGIKAGDVIAQINDVSVKGKSSDEISKMMKGQSGTAVKLLIERPGETKPIEFNIVRDDIKVKDVPYYGMINSQVGYIKLTGFTTTASKEVKDAFLKLKNENNCKALILDLRDNPGGLLNEAVNIVNLFVEKGVDVAVTKGRAKEWTQAFKTVNNPIDLTMPLAVIVNRNSASASEIVSGSLQDLDRAIVIGQRTYGKGLVQQTKPLTYNAQVKVTVAKYYIPSGRCIQALDYTHRNEDGSVDHVPDSLITAFKTRNGRIVYDGAGILPDIQTEPQTLSEITYVLVTKNYIFDYATNYVIKNKQLNADAHSFRITDTDYDGFINFLQGKDIAYKTSSEEEMETLKKSAESDKYFADIEIEFKQLEKKLLDRKKDDLQKFKPEIKRIIEDEIVSRFYYLSGRIQSSISNDSDVQTAINTLASSDKTTSILTTIQKATKPFNQNKKF